MNEELLFTICIIGMIVCVIGMVYYTNEILDAQKKITQLDRQKKTLNEIQLSLLESRYNYHLAELKENEQ